MSKHSNILTKTFLTFANIFLLTLPIVACGSLQVASKPHQNIATLSPTEKFIKNVTGTRYWGDGNSFKDGYYDLLSKGKAFKKTLGSVDFNAKKNVFDSSTIIYKEYMNYLDPGALADYDFETYKKIDGGSGDFWPRTADLSSWYNSSVRMRGGMAVKNDVPVTSIQFIQNFSYDIFDFSEKSKVLLSGSAFSDSTPLDAAMLILFGWITDITPVISFSDMVPNSFAGVQRAFEQLSKTRMQGYDPDGSQLGFFDSPRIDWKRQSNDDKYFDDSSVPLLQNGERRRYTAIFKRDYSKIAEGNLWKSDYSDFRKNGQNVEISMDFLA